MRSKRVSFSRRSKTEPEKATSHLREKSEARGNFFATAADENLIRSNFRVRELDPLECQIRSLVDILLIAALLLEFADEADGFVG